MATLESAKIEDLKRSVDVIANASVLVPVKLSTLISIQRENVKNAAKLNKNLLDSNKKINDAKSSAVGGNAGGSGGSKGFLASITSKAMGGMIGKVKSVGGGLLNGLTGGKQNASTKKIEKYVKDILKVNKKILKNTKGKSLFNKSSKEAVSDDKGKGGIGSLVKTITGTIVQVCDSIVGILKGIEFFCSVGIYICVGIIVLGIVAAAIVIVIGLYFIIEMVMDKLPELIDGVLTAIKDFLGPIFDILVDVLSVIADFIAQVLPVLADAIVLIVEGLMAIYAVVFDIVISVLEAIGGCIIGIFEVISGTILTIVEAIGSIISSIFEVIGGTISKVIGVIGDCISGIYEVIGGTVLSIIETIGNFIAGLYDIVANVILGIIEAIGNGIIATVNMITEINMLVGGIIKTILEKIASFLGSPVASAGKVVSKGVGKTKNFLFGSDEEEAKAEAPAESDPLAPLLSSLDVINTTITDTITDLKDNLITTITEASTGFINTFFEKINENLDSTTSKINTVIDRIVSIVDLISSINNFAEAIAVNTYDPFKQGIKKFRDWLWGKDKDETKSETVSVTQNAGASKNNQQQTGANAPVAAEVTPTDGNMNNPNTSATTDYVAKRTSFMSDVLTKMNETTKYLEEISKTITKINESLLSGNENNKLQIGTVANT